MTFARKPRADLLAQVTNDFNSALPGVDAALRRRVVGVLSKVHGMSMDSQYGYLDWIARQIHPTTAEEEMLLRAARLWLPVPRRDAMFASGSVVFTGSAGLTVPAGSLLARKDGAIYATAADATFSSNSVTITSFAQKAGEAQNCAGSTILTLQTPIAGVSNSVTVTSSGLTGGADIESLDSVLARLMLRIQTPPQGGSGTDYVRWMYDASSNVTRAWCYPQELGAGTVTLRFCADLTYPGGIPLAGDVAAVQAYIDSMRPVAVKTCLVAAPIANPLNFTIAGLSPSTLANKAAITASLTALIQAERTPGGNYWNGYTTQAGGTILRSHMEEAIAAPPGVNDFTLVSPSSNQTCTTGYIHTMGTITWT